MDSLPSADVMGPVGPLLATFILGFTTIVLLMLYSIRQQSYWKKLGVPQVKPFPIAGSVWEISRKFMHDMELDRYNELGLIYGHYEGNRPLLSIGDPEILRNILVKDFHAFASRRKMDLGGEIPNSMLSVLQGEDWKRVRSIVTPTFTTGKIKRLLSIFKDCSKTLVKNFRGPAEKDEPVEAKTIYGAFTMDIIVSSAFSTKIDSHNDPNNVFVTTARNILTGIINWRFFVLLVFPGIARIFKISMIPPNALSFFMNATMQIMEERKKTGQTRNDFLQLLMDTAREVAQEGKLDVTEKENDMTENYGKEETDFIYKMTTKKTLSFNELVAQCIIFFLAGYDTTASTLAFASYLLALNPDVQEKLIQELDDALRQTNGELTYEVVQSLKNLDNAISETLRIYPPVVRLERVTDEDYKIQDSDIVIPKGIIVTIPIYAMHRDPKHFPDPEKFDPDRFNPEERAKRSQYAYMPFGAGPRNCVAFRFALMEVKVCLAHVLSNFRIKRCPQTKVPLDFGIGQGMLQPKEITLKFEIRKDTVKAL